jgi:Trk K+ transport system NAD-binding subunit
VIIDLRAEGLQVTVIDPSGSPTGSDGTPDDGVTVVVGDASEPGVLTRAAIEDAVAFVAGTDNDTTNLSLLAAARRLNPELFLAARQNARVNAPLFRAMQVDALLVPAEVVAHEVYAQLSTPLLWRFIKEMPAKGDDWAAHVVTLLEQNCGRELQSLWKLRLTDSEAPALSGWLASGEAKVSDLLRSPDDRDQQLPAVCLLVVRDDEAVLLPDEHFVARPGDSSSSPETRRHVARSAPQRSSTRQPNMCSTTAIFLQVGFGGGSPVSGRSFPLALDDEVRCWSRARSRRSTRRGW